MISFSLYGYTPSLPASAFFLAIFAILTITHSIIVIRARNWALLLIAVGGTCEIIGFAGRILSASDASNLNYFLIQIICLILGPTFFSAYIYYISSLLINVLGPQHSKLKPNHYLATFASVDFFCLVVQAIGGALAALALETGKDSSNGTHIMVAGIVFQLASMVVFCLLILNFYSKARKDPLFISRARPEKSKIQKLVVAIFIGSGLILLRCLYRTIELGQGWTGYLITREPYFLSLDSIPMVLTMTIFIFANPNYCLPKNYASSSNASSIVNFNGGEVEKKTSTPSSINSGSEKSRISSINRVPVPEFQKSPEVLVV